MLVANLKARSRLEYDLSVVTKVFGFIKCCSMLLIGKIILIVAASTLSSLFPCCLLKKFEGRGKKRIS